MDVRSGAVVVLVDVEVAAQDVPGGADAEVYEHDADADFEVGCDGFVVVEGDVFGDQDDGAEDDEGGGVTSAP